MILATPIKKQYLIHLNISEAIKERDKYDLTLLFIFDLTSILSIVKNCDGLLILYHEEDRNNPLLLAYIKSFIEANKPILAIQEGMLMLNAYFQGKSSSISYKRKKHLVFFYKDALLKSYYPKYYYAINNTPKEIHTLGKFLQIEAINKYGIIEAFSFNHHIYALKWDLNDELYPFIVFFFENNSKHI